MKNNKKNAYLKLFEVIDIYPVISSEFTNGRAPLDILKNVADAGVKIVQLREKNKSKREIFLLAEKYKQVCDKYGMLLIINDHVDIAMSVDAAGVHIGQDDIPLHAAQKIAKPLIIGVSTHSLDEAMAAQSAGADYINIGPVFPTSTKKVSYPPVGLETLKKIIPELKIPFTVMGGIKEHHLDTLSAIGITKVAMVTEITTAEDVKSKVIALRKKLCPKITIKF